MGRYRKDPYINFNAARLSQSFINKNVWAKKNTPQTVATIAELIPVKPDIAGNNPSGSRNSV